MVVMLVLLFLTPIFERLPNNTMAAIIIVGVSGLCELGVAVELFKVWLWVWVGGLVFARCAALNTTKITHALHVPQKTNTTTNTKKQQS